MDVTDINPENLEIVPIGKEKEINQEVILEYFNTSISELERVFGMPLDEEYELEIKRKYTYERSYLSFLFEGDDKTYDAIFQRNGRGDDLNVAMYLIEVVPKESRITRLYTENDDTLFDISAVEENLKVRDKVVGILEELGTIKQLTD